MEDIVKINRKISKESIIEFSKKLIDEIFTNSDLKDISFCLCGGCFKQLIKNQELIKPRDLDIFPSSEFDKIKLIEILSSKLNINLININQWNTKFEFINLLNEKIIIEIVSKTSPSNLIDKLSYFDIGLSCIGVEFKNGLIQSFYIDPLIDLSVKEKQVLLKIPMPNEPFLLATAERLLRYSSELNYNIPIDQINYLLEIYFSKTKDEQIILIKNYLSTTISPYFKLQVDSLFSLEYNNEIFEKKNYNFIKDKPNVYCRKYLKSELKNLIDNCISSIPSLIENKKKSILISGISASGKSSLINDFLLENNYNIKQFVLIDDDIIRGFHKQFMYELKGKIGFHYKYLLEWFMESVEYNKTIFQSENSFFNQIISENKNFIFSAIMDHEGCFDLIKYTLNHEYILNFIFIYVPIDISIKRAKERAYKTGRWTSKKFIKSKLKNIYYWTKIISYYVIENNGFVVFYENIKENCKPKKIFDSRIEDKSFIENYLNLF